MLETEPPHPITAPAEPPRLSIAPAEPPRLVVSLPRPGVRRRRFVLAPLAALAALVVLVVLAAIGTAVALVGGGSASTAAMSALAVPRTRQLLPPALRGPQPTGALVAQVLSPTALRAAPGGRYLAAEDTTTSFGSPSVLLVRRFVPGSLGVVSPAAGNANFGPGWLGVVSPAAGNGKLAWISVSDVALRRVSWTIVVSLSRRVLTVLHDGTSVMNFPVAVGRPTAPTPTGLFAVTDRIATHDPTGPYGCCILALSATAPHAIEDWYGGNRIAIHTTPETASVGLPVSHGCLRMMPADGAWLFRHIPLGTPTVIRE